MHSSTVLQRQVQAHSAIPPPPLFTGGAGAEAHLLAFRGMYQPLVPTVFTSGSVLGHY